jgi:hypothetical protein
MKAQNEEAVLLVEQLPDPDLISPIPFKCHCQPCGTLFKYFRSFDHKIHKGFTQRAQKLLYQRDISLHFALFAV